MPKCYAYGALVLAFVIVGGCHGKTTAKGNDGNLDLSSGGAGGGGSDAGDPDGGAGAGGTTLYPFTYGANLGYYGSQFTDVDTASLGRAAGAHSHRHKLTEPFLDQWGDTVHVSELTTMEQAGDADLICFLIGMDFAKSHSNAPTADDVEHYSPKNLYQPIFTNSGDVNPDNYWAAFVARVVTTYKPYIHKWEVWNEPDQVGGNWQATQTWTTMPPKPTDLVWWNDSIFAYIRMLRVTFEVVHKLDPDGKVTLGGIGYPSYLNALLRYTDEPNAGAVDADHPAKGSAYFDIISFHYYPVFAPGNSDVGAAGLITAQAALQAELDGAGVTGKPFVVTESGAPRYALGGAPGGDDYAHNYLVKAMTLAQLHGIGRIDWFALGDDKDPGASTNDFDYMGMYENLTTPKTTADAKITDTGIAYATLSGLLNGSMADTAKTAALGLPTGTNGVALQTSAGSHAYVVWATASDEHGAAKVTLPATGDATVYAWDYAKTNQTKNASASGGAVQVDVTSSPVIVVVAAP